MLAVLLLLEILHANSSDISLNLYTERGDVAQIIYASKAVEKELPSFGFIDHSETNALIINVKHKQSQLLVKNVAKDFIKFDLKRVKLF